MNYTVVLVVAIAACTSTSNPATSVEQTSTTEQVGFPCVSPSGDIASETSVTVESDGLEVAAALGWVSAGACSGDGAGVVGDGFFAGLEDAVVRLNVGDSLRVHAPGFSAADLKATWSDAEGLETIADVSEVEPGTWEIVDVPQIGAPHVLNLRFEYGEDQDAAFAVTVELQN